MAGVLGVVRAIAGAALSVGLLGGGEGARAQRGGGATVVGVGGVCAEPLRHAGRAFACSGTGMIYTVHGNGVVSFMVPAGERRVVAFVGESDRQVRPEDYVLYLTRVRMMTDGREDLAQVSGTCRATMSRDGRHWSRVDCDATDEDRAVYRLRFRGDGQPITVSRAR